MSELYKEATAGAPSSVATSWRLPAQLIAVVLTTLCVMATDLNALADSFTFEQLGPFLEALGYNAIVIGCLCAGVLVPFFRWRTARSLLAKANNLLETLGPEPCDLKMLNALGSLRVSINAWKAQEVDSFFAMLAATFGLTASILGHKTVIAGVPPHMNALGVLFVAVCVSWLFSSLSAKLLAVRQVITRIVDADQGLGTDLPDAPTPVLLTPAAWVFLFFMAWCSVFAFKSTDAIRASIPTEMSQQEALQQYRAMLTTWCHSDENAQIFYAKGCQNLESGLPIMVETRDSIQFDSVTLTRADQTELTALPVSFDKFKNIVTAPRLRYIKKNS